MSDVMEQSLILSRTLDALELSNDHVRSKVSKFSRLEVLANAVDFQPDFQNTVLTGSVIDGVCWKGYFTDIDTMHRFSYVTVTEKGQESPEKSRNHHIFEIDSENVHPGYTRLKLVKEGLWTDNIFSLTPNGAKSYCFEEEGKFYLSSSRFKAAFNRYQIIPERTAWVMQSSYNYAVNFPDEEEIEEHGPSLCFSDDTKEEPMHDSVPCFHCQEWPSEAAPWKTRQPRNWPPDDVVGQTISTGCDVVPVGFIGSQNRRLEWRLSFAAIERLLVCSFNNTQHKCYALLKMLLKDVIEAKVPNVLTSFQMKNALFWTMEKEDKTIWHDDRITEAFMSCVKTIHGFIVKGTAPGYFIPENNVLEHKMNSKEQSQLSVLFDGFLKEGWMCLMQCQSLTSEPNLETLVSLKKEDKSSMEGIFKQIETTDAKSIWLQHDLELFPRYEGARLEIMTSVSPKQESLPMTISRHHMMLQQLNDRSVNKFYGQVLEPIKASIKSSLGSHLFAYSTEIESSVKEQQDISASAEKYLVDGMKSDAAAGKLKYATYLYLKENIQQCKELAESVLRNGHKISSHVPHFLPSMFGPTPSDVNKYEEFVRENDMPLDQRYLSSACFAVLFLPTERKASPPAVQFQIKAHLPEPLEYTSWLGWALYDPQVYAHYLLFLCDMKYGNRQDAEKNLAEIEKFLDEGSIGYDISALNLLGYSYISLNDIEKGIPFLLKAMEKSISPNSVVWQMGQTLSDSLSGPRKQKAML